MPIVKLPINQGMAKATDEMGLETHGSIMRDVYIDELGNINRRPGLDELCDLGTSSSVDGLFWWEEESLAVAISNGNTYKITASDGTNSQITGDSFAAGTRVIFDDYGTHLYAANGSNAKQISTSAVANLADGDAPTSVTHVGIIDRYLLANEDGTGNFHYSDVGAPTTWSGNYSEAEAKPDDITALAIANLRVYLLGKQSLEVWYDDGTTPFQRLTQGFIQSGSVARYSFTFCRGPQTFCWLDENRRVVQLKGQQAVPLSLSLNKYIQEFTTVTDAIGDYVEVVGRPYYVLSFPTEEETLAYDFLSANWYLWNYWNSTSSSYERFRGNCFCLAPAWNYTLVGDRANGKVYKFNASNYDDDDDTLRSLIRTAHYNHGSEAKKKFCNGVYFRVKKTNVVSSDGTPDLLVRYRDDGATAWTNERTVTLQEVGETAFRAKLTRLGSYYSRQWEFVLSDAYPLCLVSVEEDVEVET